MQQRLQEIVSCLEAERARLLAAADGVPRERWRESPSERRWSTAEVLEHLRLSEDRIARLVWKLGKQARRDGHVPLETSTSSMLASLDHVLDGRGIVDRSVPRIAPEFVRPAGDIDVEAVVRGLAESRAALLGGIALVDGLALEQMRWMHPALGELNLYQYILFVAQHEARHAMQVAEIGATLAEHAASG